jgi:hypothetical protein
MMSDEKRKKKFPSSTRREESDLSNVLRSHSVITFRSPSFRYSLSRCMPVCEFIARRRMLQPAAAADWSDVSLSPVTALH